MSLFLRPSAQHLQIYFVTCKYLIMLDLPVLALFVLQNLSQQMFPKTYFCTEAHSHSTVHQPDRFYCLIPAMCSLHHRCTSLQSCWFYWRERVDHLWEYQDHHSLQLEKTKQYASRCYVYWLCHVTQVAVKSHLFKYMQTTHSTKGMSQDMRAYYREGNVRKYQKALQL